MIENVVARDGVERFGVPCFQQLADSTKDTMDREDRKDIFCVRFVCGFSLAPPGEIGRRRATRKLSQFLFLDRLVMRATPLFTPYQSQNATC